MRQVEVKRKGKKNGANDDELNIIITYTLPKN